MSQKFLIIQTAFIGDVVLATAIAENLHASFPSAEIDFLVRKGNEGLLAGHPFIHEVIIWDKKKNKLTNLLRLIARFRKTKYDKAINVQRYASTGLITAFCGATETIGFDKNPLSFLFSTTVKHVFGNGTTLNKSKSLHEIQRNNLLIHSFTHTDALNPVLYPGPDDELAVAKYKNGLYLTISPASVWFTKQYPPHKWIELINKIAGEYTIYLLGGKSDLRQAEEIMLSATHPKLVDLCGQLTFLQSAALMKNAFMNYVNDSAPMHFASAMNAPVTAVYCSTIPGFGYGPLSDKQFIVERTDPLYCRPCGIHGHKTCPQSHFKCALDIDPRQLLDSLA